MRTLQPVLSRSDQCLVGPMSCKPTGYLEVCLKVSVVDLKPQGMDMRGQERTMLTQPLTTRV